jgi:NADPH:quinone reductase-like Zn-dependent oxidoreductase/acyl carrier protein
VAAVTLPGPGDKAGPVPFHDPPLIDACLQVATAALLEEQESDGRLLLPVAVERAWCRPVSGRELLVEATPRDRSRLSSDGVVFDLRGWDDTGALVLLVEGLHLRPSRAAQLAGEEIPLYRLEWVPAERPVSRNDRVVGGRWLVLADAGGVADAVAEVLARHGESTQVVRPAPAATPDLVPPFDSGAFRDRLREILASEGPWRGIVSFQALDAASAPYGSALELEAACRAALAGALAAAQSLAGREGDSRLWLVTRGACAVDPGDAVEGIAAAGLAGLARVVALEHPELHCTRLDVEPSRHVSAPAEVAMELLGEDDELEVALRHGRRLVGRVRPTTPMLASAPAGSQRLERGSGRVLEELEWKTVARRAPGPGQVEIRVQAAGLNFRDVLNALGLYPGPEVPLGNECVGELVALGPGVEGLEVGDLVVAVAFASLADHVTTPAAMVARKPEGLSISAAATLPIAFLTAHYALHELASIRPGDRVLVHAGAGGVGLAAVQIAQRAGAIVLATAGSEEKRDLLQRLGVAAVADSRSPAFAEELRAATGGRGVDVVLNSLSGGFIERSLELTAPGGRFLELGKRDIWSADDVARVRPDVAYHVVYLGEVCEAEPERVGRWLSALLEDVAAGRLQPLPRRVFDRSAAIEAFRYMAQARHVGKVVLQVAREITGERTATLVRRGSTHLVTGGLGGVGLALAEWLSSHGAWALALVGRSRPTPAAEAVLARIRSRGVRVAVVSADVADRPALEAALARVDAEMPPLAGVWHVAGVLADATLREQDWPAFARVIAPKVLGAWNLHELTRGRHLDVFVLFSSAAALVGWPGQGNYACANASLDALAHYRRGLGLPALSVNWGAWARAGMAASLDHANQERMERRGMHFMEPARALEALEPASRGSSAQVGIAALDFFAFAGAGPGPTLRRLLADVMTGAASSGGATAQGLAAPDLGAEIAAAPASRRRALVTARVRELALRTLGLASDFPLDPRQGLREVGLDSLMAVELRNALQRLVGRPLPSTLLFDFPTVDGLSGHLLEKLGAATGAPGVPSSAMPAPALPNVSDEDAESMLRAELAELRGRGNDE